MPEAGHSFVSQLMEGLGQLKELQQLWLGRNRIQSVNLCGLTNLLKISLQSNRLTSMAAFQVSLY
jgi:protein phosphatase 1 regulatory subunit 7